jgi:hypothetical protein
VRSVLLGMESWLPSSRDGTPTGKQCELLMGTPDFRALCAELVDDLADWAYPPDENTAATYELITRARAALSQPAPEPIPHNCWLDEEYPCPTACVFDDPAECITDCTFAAKLEAEQRPKTACKHYRSEPLSQPAPCWPAGGRGMSELSPAAQAVLDAAVGYPAFATKKRIAAALRAAATYCIKSGEDFWRLNAIAAELAEASMPNPTPSRPPLWEAMHDAAIEVSKTSGPIASRRGFAAELRAIAKEIHRRRDLGSRGELLAWLRDEADRAEPGEPEDTPQRYESRFGGYDSEAEAGE